jgi:predicted alpha/beta-fold hydrolase
MKIMKKLTVIATIIMIGSWASAQALTKTSPFLSSIPALFLEPHDYEPEEAEITLHPERSEIPHFGDRNRLHYTFALQDDKTAPLLFVVPGTGGTATQPNTLYLAELAYRLGYSVVTLPSTSHWSFAMAASSDGRTGYLPKDAVDNYRLLLTLKYRLEREEEIHPRQYGLLGFSYGGLDGEQLVQQDQRQHQFGFDFLIMINTPLNLMAAIEKVDGYFQKGLEWPARVRENLKAFAVGRTIEIGKGTIKIDSPEALQKAFPLRDEKLAWILANSFRDSVQESAFVADLIVGSSSSANDSLPTDQSIVNYLKEKVFRPLSTKQHRPMESLIADNNLMITNGAGITANNSRTKTIVFHAKDDFLSFPEYSDKLENLPAELHSAETGGHLGNLASPAVINELKQVLSRVKK